MKTSSIYFCIFFLFSCSKEPSVSIEKNIYNTKYYHLELPEKFYVQRDSASTFLQENYYLYRVKNSIGLQIMTFVVGSAFETSCEQRIHIPYTSPKNIDEFSEIGRIDTIETKGGSIRKKRVVRIESRRFPSKNRSVRNIGELNSVRIDFTYYPEEIDSSICEKIIRSAKIHSYNKDYLCNVYVSNTINYDGEKMSKLRKQPLQDYFTLIKNFELEPISDKNLFEKNGKYIFLADCFLDNEYKGSFYINNSCLYEWNGKPADKYDIEDLLNSVDDELAKRIKNKCRI